MKLADLMMKIRSLLLQARAVTLTILVDIFESFAEGDRAAMAQDMKLGAFDAIGGIPWKSEIPSIEQIQQVFGDTT